MRQCSVRDAHFAVKIKNRLNTLALLCLRIENTPGGDETSALQGRTAQLGDRIQTQANHCGCGASIQGTAEISELRGNHDSRTGSKRLS